MSYNLLELSSVDFENIICDLFQKSLNLKFETFKEGKDGGIDVLTRVDGRNHIVIQCKRYKNYSDLKSNIKNSEQLKAKGIICDKYLLLTTVELSNANKKELQSLSNGYIKNSDDIYGKEDIDILIRKYPDVIHAYPKLWLPAREVLESLLLEVKFSGERTRNEEIIDQIEKKSKIYVDNPSFNTALKMLNDSGFCVISGEPGIGKTTLAYMLVANLITNHGRKLAVVNKHIKEARDLLSSEDKIVFLYDDFLGTTNFYEKLDKNEETLVIDFLKNLKKRNALMILTTREYILKESFAAYEKLKREENFIEKSKCVVELGSYTKMIRAKILYNHIYYSELPFEYKKDLVETKSYQAIISHGNYNPRIIEEMTRADSVILKDISENSYSDYFLYILRNPKIIWENAFRKHLDDVQRAIILQVAIKPKDLPLHALEKSVISYLGLDHKNIDNDTFTENLKSLEGSFISLSAYNWIGTKGIYVSFQNPSVKDFTDEYIKDNIQIVKKLIDSAIEIEHLIPIYSQYDVIKNNREIAEQFGKKIIQLLSYKSQTKSFSRDETRFLLRVYKEEHVKILNSFMQQNKDLIDMLIDSSNDSNVLSEIASALPLLRLDMSLFLENFKRRFFDTIYYIDDISRYFDFMKKNYQEISDEFARSCINEITLDKFDDAAYIDAEIENAESLYSEHKHECIISYIEDLGNIRNELGDISEPDDIDEHLISRAEYNNDDDCRIEEMFNDLLVGEICL